MAEGAGPRRLAALLAAELVHHAAHKTRDPMGALDRARQFADQADAAIRPARGTTRNALEGLVVAEFASALDAVGCARALLARIAELNAAKPAPARLEVRVAVHVGEFLTAGESLSAEALDWPVQLLHDADAGGLVLTRDAREEVRRAIPLRGRMVRPRRANDLPAGLRVFAVPPPGAGFFPWWLRRGGWKPVLAGLVLIGAGLAALRAGIPGLGIPGAPAGPAPEPVVVRSIHGCDGQAGTFTYEGDGGAVKVEFVRDGWKGGAVKLVHGTIRTGSFWGFVFQSGEDWSAYAGIRITMKSAAGQPVRLQLIEEPSGEDWVTELVPGPDWRTYEVPFSRLIPRPEYNPGVRDNLLTLTHVRVLEIIQATATSDTLWVDDLCVYGPTPNQR